MSDRIAERVESALEELDSIEPETGEQKRMITDIKVNLGHIAKNDRTRNGPTPTDQLVALIDSTDECLNCGEPIDEGGWCDLGCMKSYYDSKLGDS